MEKDLSPIEQVTRAIIPLLILAVGVGVFWASARLKSAPPQLAVEESINLVSTKSVEAYEGDLRIYFDGTVVPFREIQMAAEVEGRIKTKTDMCRAGRAVTAGTLLLEIDPVDFDLHVRQLSRELAHAKSQVHELEVQAENTRSLTLLAKEDLKLQDREVRRLRELKNDRIITDTDLERVLRAELSSKNALQTLVNQVRTLSARRETALQTIGLTAAKLEMSQLELKRTKIFAPIDGVIVQEPVEVDNYVKAGQLLTVINDTSAVEVKCNLRMEHLSWLWHQSGVDLGKEVEANIPLTNYELPHARALVTYELNGRKFEWDGVLSRYDGLGLDERTRTVPCRVLVEAPQRVRILDMPGGAAGPSSGPPALVRGMFVNVTIFVTPQRKLIKLPREAVQPGNIVWRVDDGQLASRQVQIARLLRDDTALVYADGASVTIGDHVVVSPLAAAVDGMPVKEQILP